MALKYRGKDPNTDWFPGIPARDLTGADLKELGLKEAEVDGSLYSQSAAPAKKPRKPRGAPESTTEGTPEGSTE